MAGCTAYLQIHQIFHCDVQPKNVLLRVFDGQMVGNAKICDSGVSRKAVDRMAATVDSSTRTSGRSLYMPQEAFSNPTQKGSKRSRDVWDFGVLMCFVFVPNQGSHRKCSKLPLIGVITTLYVSHYCESNGIARVAIPARLENDTTLRNIVNLDATTLKQNKNFLLPR